MATPTKLRDFYPPLQPFHSQMLEVGDDHQLYIEQCGNPEGIPVLFVHGGPGAGCSENDRRFFDPRAFRVILVDQRGCGRSKPHGSLTNNTTAHLIADFEVIREHLQIAQWHLFGGSWGSTLSLAYAQTHPEVVLSLNLRGIFLARPGDAEWAFDHGGASKLYPDAWQQFLSALPERDRATPLQSAYRMLTSDDKPLAEQVALAWSQWEYRIGTLEPDPALVANNSEPSRCWTLARHEAHYLVNQCFLADRPLLENTDKIAHIPTAIVHGRYDVICPFDNAWALHQALPESELIICYNAGHASSQPEIKDALIRTIEQRAVA